MNKLEEREADKGKDKEIKQGRWLRMLTRRDLGLPHRGSPSNSNSNSNLNLNNLNLSNLNSSSSSKEGSQDLMVPSQHPI